MFPSKYIRGNDHMMTLKATLMFLHIHVASTIKFTKYQEQVFQQSTDQSDIHAHLQSTYPLFPDRFVLNVHGT